MNIKVATINPSEHQKISHKEIERPESSLFCFFLQRESCVCLQTTDCYEIICRQAEISMNLI